MNAQQGLGTAVVTGASSGIGAIYADRLARRGYRLILVARNRARLDGVATTLQQRWKASVETFPGDLTQRADLLRLEQRLHDDPAVTMLVNNAGTGMPGGLVNADVDGLERMVRLNVIAVMRLAAAAATAFAARRRGTIVNVASILALVPELFNGTYSGTKAFVLNLTQSMQEELKDSGVRVQAVLPGALRTEFWQRAGTDLATLPASMVMDADELVDTALTGLDHGELVTIPSLPDLADWEAFTAARRHLQPNLSRDSAAPRYRAAAA